MLPARPEVDRVDAKPGFPLELGRRDPEAAALLHAPRYLGVQARELFFRHLTVAARANADRRHRRSNPGFERPMLAYAVVEMLRLVSIRDDPLSDLSRDKTLEAHPYLEATEAAR